MWIAGWHLLDEQPMAAPTRFSEWRAAFSHLREHFLCHAWECGELDVEANLSSLAFAEGYCEDTQFEYFAHATQLNYFIHQELENAH